MFDMSSTGPLKIAVVLLGCFVAAVVWSPQLLVETSSEQFAVHFIDVGQGDAIFIQTPDGYEALIDGGRTGAVVRELAARQSWWDRDVDLVIATHADEDHVGGLVDVLEYYDVRMVLQTEAIGESPGAAAFSAATAAENAAVVHARAGQVIQLGASTTIEVLSPATPTDNWRTNAASIIVRVTYGDTAVLLSGDAPASIEDYWVGAELVFTERSDNKNVNTRRVNGADFLKADILKLGHHGSQTSTSEAFLAAVDPDYAVVSAGLDNQYGHPHQSVIARVFTRDIPTFHTGLDGTITFYSDGTRVWVE